MRNSTKGYKFVLCLFVAFLLGFTVPALSQVGTSSILGYVHDSSGAAIPGAQATLSKPATGLKVTATTNNTGLYKFLDLLPGTYRLSVTKPGFQAYEVHDIVLQVAQHAEYNATLKVGAVTQSVTVGRAGFNCLRRTRRLKARSFPSEQS